MDGLTITYLSYSLSRIVVPAWWGSTITIVGALHKRSVIFVTAHSLHHRTWRSAMVSSRLRSMLARLAQASFDSRGGCGWIG
jgi:hypothetical protein